MTGKRFDGMVDTRLHHKTENNCFGLCKGSGTCGQVLH